MIGLQMAPRMTCRATAIRSAGARQTPISSSSSYSPVQHDLNKPKEKMLLRRIRESRAEAAIVSAAKMCEPGLDEQVAYSEALDEEDIPYFVTEFEETMARYDHLKIQLETFVENILSEFERRKLARTRRLAWSETTSERGEKMMEATEDLIGRGQEDGKRLFKEWFAGLTSAADAGERRGVRLRHGKPRSSSCGRSISRSSSPRSTRCRRPFGRSRTSISTSPRITASRPMSAAT